MRGKRAESPAEDAAITVLSDDSIPDSVLRIDEVAKEAYEDPGAYDPSSSTFSAPPEQHAKDNRKPGRARKDGISPKVAATGKDWEVPGTNYSSFKSDAVNPNQKTRAFYKYWNELPEWAKGKTICYVYRDWPVLLSIDDDAEKEKPAGQREYKYIDKISGNTPLQDDTDLMQRFGCGGYSLSFNEQPGRGQICQVMIPMVGNDMKSFPPSDKRVVRFDQYGVDLNHPANKSYVDFLRMRGKLPEQKDEEEEMAQLAQVEAVRALTESNERLTSKVIDMAEQKGEARASTPQATADNALLNGVVQGMTQTFGAGITMLSDAAKKSNEIMAQQQHTPAPGVDPVVNELRNEIARLREDRFAQQIDILRAEMRAIAERSTSNNNPPQNVSETVSTFKQMRELFEDLGIGETKAAAADNKPWWVDFALALAPVVAPIAQSFMARAMTANQPQQQPVTTVTQMPSVQQQPQQQPQPQQIAPATNEQVQLQKIIGAIEKPLDAHLMLQEEKSGELFAQHFIDGFSEDWFKYFKADGSENLRVSLLTYPSIAGVMAKYPSTKVATFLSEFCAYQPMAVA